VKEKLAEQGYDMNVSVNEVKKLNETYEAMTVTPEGARIGMNVNLEKFYEAYDEGRPLGEVVDKALETIDHAINERPDFDIDSFTDYSQMKGKLAMSMRRRWLPVISSRIMSTITMPRRRSSSWERSSWNDSRSVKSTVQIARKR